MRLYIINRNWLTTTRGLVAAAHRWGAEPILVDCESTYPPLLDWYASAPCRVVRFTNNGPYAPWHAGLIAQERGEFAVTDADLLVDHLPDDTLEHLRDGLRLFPFAIRAGVSLEIDDLPDDAPLTSEVTRWESRFWRDRADAHWFRAAVGCTLAVYRPGSPGPGIYTPAIRADRPYTARHLPWYCTAATLTDEQRYFFEHVDHVRSCWGTRLKQAFCEHAHESENHV